MIKNIAKAQEEQIIAWRRWFHENPELSTEEFNTTAYIVKTLEEIGVSVETFSDITGCIGTIKGKNSGKTVMLRADIDALPITEETGKDYSSKNPGVMHACGHDAHAAMLLGAAKILTEKQDEINGTIKLIFQMGEEIGRMSDEYVKRDCLKGVDAIFGMHAWSLLDAGTANFEIGERMACSDKFIINIHGKSAHGSSPQEGHDAILGASASVLALQSLVSRVNHPQHGFVVTVGQMNGGTKENIVADNVELVGTVRAFNSEFRKTVPELIEKVVNGAVSSHSCTASFTYKFGPDPLINQHENLVTLAQNAAKELISEDALVPLQKMTGAEDFSCFSQVVPSVYGFLGARNKEKGIVCSHHQNTFDVDETILYKGAGIYAKFALDFLNE